VHYFWLLLKSAVAAPFIVTWQLIKRILNKGE
jgi:hypothetical protein